MVKHVTNVYMVAIVGIISSVALKLKWVVETSLITVSFHYKSFLLIEQFIKTAKHK